MLYNTHVFLDLLAHKFFCPFDWLQNLCAWFGCNWVQAAPANVTGPLMPSGPYFFWHCSYSRIACPGKGKGVPPGDCLGDLAAPPRTISARRLLLTDSVSVSSSIDGAREVLAFDASSPCFCRHRGDSRGVCCLICCLMDGDLGAGFLDVDGGFALDLGDFGLWLWIWL